MYSCDYLFFLIFIYLIANTYMASSESPVSHPSLKYTIHIIVMPQHLQGLCNTCKSCHYTVWTGEVRPNYMPAGQLEVKRRRGELRACVCVAEENVRNDKRPATGTGRQKLFTEVKRQVGGILAIPRIALPSGHRNRLCEMTDTKFVRR